MDGNFDDLDFNDPFDFDVDLSSEILSMDIPVNKTSYSSSNNNSNSDQFINTTSLLFNDDDEDNDSIQNDPSLLFYDENKLYDNSVNFQSKNVESNTKEKYNFEEEEIFQLTDLFPKGRKQIMEKIHQKTFGDSYSSGLQNSGFQNVLKSHFKDENHINSTNGSTTFQSNFNSNQNSNLKRKRKFEQPFQNLFLYSSPSNFNSFDEFDKEFPFKKQRTLYNNNNNNNIVTDDENIMKDDEDDITDEYVVDKKRIIDINKIEISANGQKRYIYVEPKKYNLYIRKNKLIKLKLEYNRLFSKIKANKVIEFEQENDNQNNNMELLNNENVIAVELYNIEKRSFIKNKGGQGQEQRQPIEQPKWEKLCNYEDLKKYIIPSKKGFLSLINLSEGLFNIVIKLKLNEKQLYENSVFLKITYRLLYCNKYWYVYYILMIDTGRHNSEKIQLKQVMTTVKEENYNQNNSNVVNESGSGNNLFNYEIQDENSVLKVDPFDFASYPHFTPTHQIIGQFFLCCKNDKNGKDEIIPMHKQNQGVFWRGIGLSKRKWASLSKVSFCSKKKLFIWVMAHGLRKENPIFENENVRLIQKKENFKVNKPQMKLMKDIVELFSGYKIVLYDMNRGTSVTIDEIVESFLYMNLYAQKNENINIVCLCPWVYILDKKSNKLDNLFKHLNSNIVVINSAGNQSKDISGELFHYPTSLNVKNIVTCGCYDMMNKKVSDISNYGSNVYLYCIGTSTSYSVVYTAMVASILWSLIPMSKGGRVKLMLKKACIGVDGLSIINNVDNLLGKIVEKKIEVENKLRDLSSLHKIYLGIDSLFDEKNIFQSFLCYNEIVGNQIKDNLKVLEKEGLNDISEVLKKVESLKIKLNHHVIENDTPKIDYSFDEKMKDSDLSYENLRLTTNRGDIDFKEWKKLISTSKNIVDNLFLNLQGLFCKVKAFPNKKFDEMYGVLMELVKKVNDEVIQVMEKESKIYGSFIKAIYYFYQKKGEKSLEVLDGILSESSKESNYSIIYFVRGTIRISISTQEFEKTLDDYQKANKLNPGFSIAMLNIGLIYEKLKKDYSAALNCYTKSIEINPESYDSYFARGNLYFLQYQDYMKARLDFNSSILLNPQVHKECLLNRSILFETKLNNEKLAFKDLNFILKNYPNEIHALFNRMMLNFKTNKFSDSLDDCDRLFVLRPDEKRLYNMKGILFTKLKKYEKAFNCFEYLVKEEHCSAQILNNMSLVLFLQGKVEESLKTINEAIKIDPSISELFSNRGFLNLRISKFKEALTDFDSSINRNMGNYLAFKNRGLFYLKSKQWVKALLDFNEALKNNPSDSYLYFLRGVSLIYDKDKEHSVKDLSRFIKLNPDCAYGWFYRGMVLSFSGPKTIGDVIKDFTNAIRLKNDYARAYNNRGFILSAIKQPKNAIKDFNKAIELDKNYLNAYFNRANVNNKFNIDLDQALTDYNKCISINGSKVIFYLQRGKLYEKMGRQDLMKTDMEMFFKHRTHSHKNHE